MPAAASPAHSPIAIVGMSGRFPEAPSTDAFWQLLEEGREAVGTAPADRPWMHELYDPAPRTPGRIPTTRGGFLSGIDRFDAGFFDISPREAARVDPQLRILLETAHETIEDSGIPGDRLARRPAGVFIGSCSSDYWLRHIADPDGIDFYTELGATSRSAHSGRLAYAFDLRGPAVSVDVACSSSLLAVHLACQSLSAGECDTALAGGVNITLTPYTNLAFAWAGGLSPDGSCKFADASANGFVRSEGAGLVLLKPLERALADGDRVRAVIRGSAVNNNGFSGTGIAAPTLDGQRDAIRRAYRHAGADPAGVDFVEAHGTGTPLGDSTELAALAQEMSGRRGAPFLVASGKANIGHTEGAAGIAGLIKAVLSLERRRVPGNPHLLTPNPAVDWETAPFRVPKENAELPAEGELLAGVNSLGASGTNVHVVLASAPSGTPSVDCPPCTPSDGGTPSTGCAPSGGGALGPHLLTLSARSPGALRELADAHRRLLLDDEPPPLGDWCAAAARQRTHHEWRLAVTGDDAEELAESLEDPVQGSPVDRPRIVFVFPGQGSQWHGMGRELLARSEAFRTTLERCSKIIEAETGWSLLDALRGEDASWQERTAYVQPALWAMGVALADHWRAWGIVPDAVLGHSQGEIAAACCAGALTLEEAGRLSCLRARLLDELAPPGAMAWVGLAHTDAAELLTECGIDAQVAVAESASSAVLSGSPAELDRLVDVCAEWGVECRRIPVAYAAHSAQIDAVRRPLLAGLADLAPAESTVPFLSTVTGGELSGTRLDRTYWWRNLRETVLLEPVVARSGPEPVVYLQMSPHPVLSSALRNNAGSSATVLGSLRRDQPELRCLLDSLGLLYEAGGEPDWDAVHPRGGRAPKLPAYPWQRRRHWYQADGYPYPPIGEAPSPEFPEPEPEPVVEPVPCPGPALDLVRDRFLLDHRVGGMSVMPGTGFLELLLDAAGPAGELTSVAFHELLPLDEKDPPELRVRNRGPVDGIRRLEVESRTGKQSRTGEHWTRHASARSAEAGDSPNRAERPDDVRRRCGTRLNGEAFYRRYSGRRNSWEGDFRSVAELWHGPGEVLARITARPGRGRRLHPAVLDACLQPLAVLHSDPARGFVLTGVDRLWVRPGTSPAGEVWAHARVTGTGPQGLTADITVSDTEGRTVAELTGLRAKALSPTASAASRAPDTSAAYEEWLHAVSWEPARIPDPVPEPGNYLLLGTAGRLDRRLTRALTAAGHTVTTATHEADLHELLDEAAEDGPIDAVVCLYDDETPANVQDEAVRLCSSLTDAVRAVLEGGAPRRLMLVTRGARQARGEDGCPAPWQAAVWGLGLVVGEEHPQLATVLVDLDENSDPKDDAQSLTRLLLSRTAESQVAVRGGDFLAPRLAAAPSGAPDEPLALFTEGGLDGLRLVPAERCAPGPGEIEIEVTHVGLNYHDVLAAAGADGDAAVGPPQLGCECSGTVVRTGPDVTEFAVGDPVMAFSYPSARTRLTVPAELVAPVPGRLSQAEAATLPAAHATAYYALVERARLAPGERVLIHSATGGVGLAAISVARMCGATVYATAGTPAKRELLRRLGVERVADSRTTDFAEEFSDGVDVVLGTLVGAGVDAGFSVLNPFGRYVDLSINDIAAARPLPMNVFAGSRSYLPVNLLDLYRYAPRHLGELVRTVAGLVDDGTLEPPTTRVFPATEATEAFTLMARSGHTGKVALAMPRRTTDPARIRPGASYLVTGGLSGVGGLLAEWLTDQGATHLLLTGRTDLSTLPSDDHRLALLERLRQSGTEIEYAAVDAADHEALAEVLRRRDREGLPPVAGAAHAAAVLTPGPVTDLTTRDLDRTLHPKVAGGWALHQLFADQQLDFFVLFSSAVSVLGGLTAGHHLGAYAAANAFTDALAAHRAATGLPATVVNWGYWTEVGIAARLSEANGHDVRPRGMGPIRPADAPALFSELLRAPGQRLMYPPVDWDGYLAAYPGDADNPLLYARHAEPGRGGAASPAAPPVPEHVGHRPKGPAARPGSPPVRTPRRQVPGSRTAPAEDGRTTSGIPTPPRTGRATAGAAAHAAEREERTGAPARPSRTRGADGDQYAAGRSGPTAQCGVPASGSRPAGDAPAIEDRLAAHLAAVLGTDTDQISRSRSMNRLGMDSLMAVEVRTRMSRDHDLDIPVARLLGSESLRTLAAALAAGDDRGAST
ncbi:beta-ketoacyl synthase N-terminal-like domain-containing protein [Streptomyces sp. NPDC021093]|uniref:beta-ketoacyl synthase N-terminal-like domain-containing protein n=1 Tax=Streptomyces sp. NPDC021093 TaxID=3365112 RepID=UPI00379C333E